MSDLGDLYETDKTGHQCLVMQPSTRDERIEANAQEIYEILKKMYSFGEPVRVDGHRAKAKEVFRKACAMISTIENGPK
jgi:DNA anti-recombination protein RmuC